MMKRLLISLLLVGTALPAVAQHVARPSGESPIRPAKTSQVQPATRESELEPQVGEAEMREAQVRRLEAEKKALQERAATAEAEAKKLAAELERTWEGRPLGKRPTRRVRPSDLWQLVPADSSEEATEL